MYKHLYSYLTKHANMWCILQKEIQTCYCLKLVIASEECELWTLRWTTAERIFSNESSDVITFTTIFSLCFLDTYTYFDFYVA